MAGQFQQQQMKTSFLFIQLRAPPACALPAPSPAATPGGLEEGHSFPSPRTGFLAGRDLRRTQGSAAPPLRLLQKAGPETEEPAAFTCSAPREKKEGRKKSQDPDVSRGGDYRSPHYRHCQAPASKTLGGLQPRAWRLPSPVPVMSDESSSPSMGWKHWPVTSATQDLWGMDPRCRDNLGCFPPRAVLVHTADGEEKNVLRRGAETCQILPGSCKEATGPAVQATRARLYRYCPAVHTSKGCPAPPATLPLKAETFVWVNNASAHSQSVAKAKYEFLFGRAEGKTPDTTPSLSDTDFCFGKTKNLT
uniref:Pleckstrin and Sec7 domain containing 3 n=1 Tax=Papio anubis TaxID=9555 RepID=A0A8I5N1V9_PAPAN